MSGPQRENPSPPGKPDRGLDDMLYDAAQRLVLARRHTVLLVEDTAAHAAIIRRAIDESIWLIEHVTRASIALEKFSDDPQRIVLLDLSLPDGNGLQVLNRMHVINPEAPIIVVTSTDQVSVSVEAMRNGACDYVVKSDPKQTATRIAEALQSAWQQRVRDAQNRLVEQAQIIELARSERHDAVENVMRTVCAEVNNPLSGVIALAHLLLHRDNLDDDLRQIAGSIARAATQAAEVVQNLTNAEDVPAPPSASAEDKVTE